eukprot:CAMPEP_0184346568 /NCGR_PEP_ID=MMETSP1089-20130417/14813_1 /TAXON_ID=38269 ORGANISM="Gloeochaete wittrockiana, Strain SAG46.84" /NCGR_SAMPLE_ID=MMETSP1089 /ASSEMBLY_ACC=CAM_ASM_000445 /LENGTH=116 /DNA_ID=CAMNT_0026677295 /DNA_START=24 /DNA_END=371 /DNA_ORIENTATION=+
MEEDRSVIGVDEVKREDDGAVVGADGLAREEESMGEGITGAGGSEDCPDRRSRPRDAGWKKWHRYIHKSGKWLMVRLPEIGNGQRPSLLSERNPRNAAMRRDMALVAFFGPRCPVE